MLIIDQEIVVPKSHKVIIEKDKKERPFISVACEGDGANLWWPLKDHIADEPDNGAKMTYTVPEDLFCVSNGRLTSTTPASIPGKKEYIWEVINPINNLTFTNFVKFF